MTATTARPCSVTVPAPDYGACERQGSPDHRLPSRPLRSLWTKSWRSSRLAVLGLGVALNLAIVGHPVADAAEKQATVLTYDVYAGGFHVVTGQARLEENSESYALDLQANTRGMLSGIIPLETRINATGQRVNGTLMPERYHNESTVRGRHRFKTMRFEPDGPGWVVVDSDDVDGAQRDAERVNDAQRREALDPVSAAVAAIMTPAQGSGGPALDQACHGRVPIFDGKRRFDLLLSSQGLRRVEANRYSAFSGAAVLCSMDFEQVDGFDPDGEGSWFWSDGGRGDTPLKVWLADAAGNGTPVPVRMEAPSRLGTVFVHLSDVRTE